MLVGDVWLCSGQSNMEWPVRNTLDAGSEVALSANERIRQVTIARATSAAPRADFDAPLEWKVAGPATTEHFSAACYYFVRELQKTVDVPQGIISSNWGGSAHRAVDERGRRCAPLDGYQEPLELLGEYRTNRAVAFWHWGEIWQKWWLGAAGRRRASSPGLAGDDGRGWQRAPAAARLLGNLGRARARPLRRHDVVPRAREARHARRRSRPRSCRSGSIDDVDVTWINGRAVGNGFGDEARVYDLPPKLLKAGDNLVVVNVHDFWGNGGLHGPAEQRALLLADGTRVPLDGLGIPGARRPDLWPPHAPWESLARRERAVQRDDRAARQVRAARRRLVPGRGECRVSTMRANTRRCCRRCMADWRRQFEAPLPFLVVQLANFGKLADHAGR